MNETTAASKGIDLLVVARDQIEPALSKVLNRLGDRRTDDGPPEGHDVPPRLAEAIRHAVLLGGKRLRPALAMGGAVAVGAPPKDALVVACAVEMVHGYSLVHDDLPALDNDPVRRGHPSCHVAFGEATALLAGDALVTEALGLVADGIPIDGEPRPSADRRARATAILARAAGAAGMVGGQHDDLAAEAHATPQASVEQLIAIHRRKTGRLIQASVVLGALYTRGTDDDIEALRRFGAGVGLAFQLVDDVLDADGLAALWAADRVRRKSLELTEAAVSHLSRFGSAGDPLRNLAYAIVSRTS